MKKGKIFLWIAVVLFILFLGYSFGNLSKVIFPEEKTQSKIVYPVVNNISPEKERYVKFVIKDGITYAGVVVPNELLTKRPGKDRDIAKMYLAKKDKRRWVDEKKEEKDGYTVFIFRELTEKETKEADRAREEMKQPFIQ